MVFFLAVRSLYLNRRRYAMIAAAVACGFAIITLISAASAGAMGAIRAKASRYFAGAVSVTGYSPKGEQGIERPDELVRALSEGLSGARSVAKRTLYYRQDARLFFGGQTIRQRRLVGVDFAGERAEFQGMAFEEGGFQAMEGADGRMGILISSAAAELLGARNGDSLELFLTTDAGQYNAATLIVRGVFAESSLFGYVSYMRNQDLNELIGRPEGAATDLAVYVRPGITLRKLAADAHRILAAERSVLPLAADRDERQAALAEEREEEVLVVMSLDAQLAQIADVMDAFMAVSYFVLVDRKSVV